MDELGRSAPGRCCGQQDSRLKRLGKKRTATPFDHGKFPRIHSGQACETNVRRAGVYGLRFGVGNGQSRSPYKEQNEPKARLFCVKISWLSPLGDHLGVAATAILIATRVTLIASTLGSKWGTPFTVRELNSVAFFTGKSVNAVSYRIGWPFESGSMCVSPEALTLS